MAYAPFPRWDPACDFASRAGVGQAFNPDAAPLLTRLRAQANRVRDCSDRPSTVLLCNG